tara:strand:+ start:383 stop:559 length:177 start_codon:yes stop_codon:yes gene_type:complete
MATGALVIVGLSLTGVDEGAGAFGGVDQPVSGVLHMSTPGSPRAGGRSIFLDAVGTIA